MRQPIRTADTPMNEWLWILLTLFAVVMQTLGIGQEDAESKLAQSDGVLRRALD